MKNKIEKIENICILLYKNEADGFVFLETEFKWISEIMLEAAKDIENFNSEELLIRLKRLVEAFHAKDVFKTADVLKYEITEAIVYICGMAEDSLYENLENVESVNSKTSIGDYKSETNRKESIPINPKLTDISNFEINLNSLKKSSQELYEAVKELCENFDINDETIMIDECFNLEVKHEDTFYYINSHFNSENQAHIWAEDIVKKVNYKSIVIMIGLSDAAYIRQTLNMLGEENILIVYEPEVRIFCANMMYNNISDIIEDKRCIMFSENFNMEEFHSVVSNVLGYDGIELSRIYALPVYDVLYAPQIEAFISKLRKEFDAVALLNNTIIIKNENVISNIIKNLHFAITGSSIDQLKDEVRKVCSDKNISAILVAAGPSLDKNIKFLKEAKGKAFIIGVDSSIRMLLKHDIIPDVLVTIDPDKERVLFEDSRTNEIPIVYCMHSTNDILEKNVSRKFVFCNFVYIYLLFQKAGKELGALDTGGSVANTAYSLASYLEFKNIIMIGQDLAFTDNKKHASVVYDETEINDDEKPYYEFIEGSNGEQLLTFKNFRVYRDWYETRIALNKDINVINATEGGALIRGTVNMTLKEAISQYCDQEVDFTQSILACEDAFSREEKDKLKEIVLSVPQDCEELKKLFREAILCYKKIYHGMPENEFNRILKDADKITQKCDNIMIMEFVSYYARKKEVEVKSGLYDNSDNEAMLRCEVAEKSITLLEEYIKASDRVKQQYVDITERIRSI